MMKMLSIMQDKLGSGKSVDVSSGIKYKCRHFYLLSQQIKRHSYLFLYIFYLIFYITLLYMFYVFLSILYLVLYKLSGLTHHSFYYLFCWLIGSTWQFFWGLQLKFFLKLNEGPSSCWNLLRLS